MSISVSLAVCVVTTFTGRLCCFPTFSVDMGASDGSTGILAGVGSDRISCVLSVDGVDALMLKVKWYSVLST